jgi:predicted RNA-binding protein with PIN domain
MAETGRGSVSMLRPALELAWLVAKAGSQARPPLPVPGPMRPIMRVARLPDRMLETIRQVVEEDAGFRERVASAAEEPVLGRPSWLWLVRPDGWEAELGGLVEEAAGVESEQREKRDALAAERRLADLTSNVRRLQAELVALKAANEELREADARRRRDNRAQESETGDLRRRLHEAAREVERLSALNDDLEARVASHAGQLADVADQRAADLGRLRSAGEQLRAALERTEDAELRARLAEAEVSALRARLARAEAGARALADDIAGRPGPQPAGSVDDGHAGGGGTDPQPSEGVTGDPGAAPGRRLRRVPLRLPPATFEDSPEAAAHLVRVAGVLLAVDGYNVTLSSWPSLELAEQRRRLIDSLGELAMRAGTEILVVFDGVDDGNRLQPGAALRGRLRVQFSPSEVEADDVIISAVRSVPASRPVVVATNDRRVRDATADLGANVISVDQLLAVIGRHTPLR